MTLSKGDRVRVTNDRHDFEGELILVSENKRSIAVLLDGEPRAIHTSRGGMYISQALPLLQDDTAGTFTDMFEDAWTVTKQQPENQKPR